MIIVQAKVEALVKTAIDEENAASAGTDRDTSTGSPDIKDAEVDLFEDAFLPKVSDSVTDKNGGHTSRSRNTTPNEDSEVERYIIMPLAVRTSNPLSWWKDHDKVSCHSSIKCYV